MNTIPVPTTRNEMQALANAHDKLSAIYSRWKYAYSYRYGAHPLARAALLEMVETEQVLDSAFHCYCIRALFRHGAGRACVTSEYSWKVKPSFNFLATLNRAIGMGAFNARDFDRVQSFLENRTGCEYTWTADGKIEDHDEVQYCDLSGEYYSSSANMVRFTTSRGRGSHRNWPCEQAIEQEVNRHCFYCERTSEWYLSDEFREIEVEGDTLCFEANEDDLYYWESDGDYHFDPEPEEDEDDDNNGRASYHSTRPSWWSNPHAHHRISGTTPLFGMELEINCRDMGDFCSALRNTGLLTECDASLDSVKGVEVIGGPYSLEQYQKGVTAWEYFYPRIALDECVGHEAHKDSKPYGIHISISRSSFASDYHLSRFVVFFNVAERLCKEIAQRDVIYSGGYKIRTKPGKRALRTTKYETVNVSDSRAEVRIFRSNCRKDRQLKNIEFCHAVFEFVRMASLACLSDERWAASEFLAWLALPANTKTYPHLVDFLGNFNYKFFSDRLAKKRKGNPDKK